VPVKLKAQTTIEGHALTFSNLDKVLWPDDGYTKGDLISYYLSVAKWLLPHLQNRPLTLQRFPDGIDGPSFFEKQAPRYTPSWIDTIATTADGNSRKVAYILCNQEATLAWCANLASIVLHVWYSRVPKLECPEYVLFDLDPAEACATNTLATVALAFRDHLKAIGCSPLVKTTGGSGLDLIIPLKLQYDVDTAKQFAESLARRIAHELPELTTLERSLARRPKKHVYLDWVQVGRGKTVVPPYVVRARGKAPVSMPLDWMEVETLARKRGGDPSATNAAWKIRNALKRLQSAGDMWGPKTWKPAALEPAIKKAQKIWKGGKRPRYMALQAGHSEDSEPL